MYKLDKKFKIIIIATIVVLFSVVSYYIYANSDEGEVFSYNEALSTNVIEDKKEDVSKEETKNTIVVHVAGCVVNPGIVQLQENARIADAIEKAGGLTEDGDISKLNLAYFLEDGMKIYVPSHNEIEEEKVMENDINNSTQYVTESSGTADANSISNTSENSGKKSVSKVNINTATQSELETLPGIGSATSLKIISYRNENGKFKSIEDIKNVKGIGDSKYESIKDLICVK